MTATTLGQPLTTREAEILRYATQGLSNHAISKALWISVDTVKSHLSKAYRKLGAKGRDHAAQLLAAQAETSTQ